jgi:hypothetical protein
MQCGIDALRRVTSAGCRRPGLDSLWPGLACVPLSTPTYGSGCNSWGRDAPRASVSRHSNPFVTLTAAAAVRRRKGTGYHPVNARGVLDRQAGNSSAVHRTSLASLEIAKGESRPPPVRCPVPLVDQPAEDRRDLAVEHVTFGLRHLLGDPHHTRARQGE